MTCPDCITYGFAIGDSGSEKSKVITDTAYSLTPYDDSHETRTLNAPYEDGTMSRQGEGNRSRGGQAIKPAKNGLLRMRGGQDAGFPRVEMHSLSASLAVKSRFSWIF
jgi:hypothetical protein